MTKCQQCKSDVPVTVTLNHVSFNKSPISSIHGSLTVCLDCRDELKNDPDVEW